ncbi:MAG: beta-galactosidase [Paludibacter sp.]
MKKTTSILLFIFLMLHAGSQTISTSRKDFIAGKNSFLLNGKPFIIRAGELHYSRIPKPYWEHRIQMCKAMGMNTICIYLFWNYHEQQAGIFDFSGEKDVAEFVRLIQKNGMYCILRPGPYVCAEWEMGGLPWWLLKKQDLKVRTLEDKYFIERTKMFLSHAGMQLAKYQIQNGGPIIMVQVENEYGVWGNDRAYIETIRDEIRASGFDKVQLFRCDWSSNFDRYNVSGIASTLNFGSGSNIDNEFKKFKELNPDAPLMCSEYWTGWFDHWGSPHETRSVNSFIYSLKEMMDRKISFSLYMAHGGTSFGQWAGANSPSFSPTTSSYDYNAPIDEAGNTTDKFYAIRNLLKNYLQEGDELPKVPANPEKTIIMPAIHFSYSASLFRNLPLSQKSKDIHSMEYYNQGWGSILYRTRINACREIRKLKITNVHDWAIVFINGKRIAILDRRLGDTEIKIPALSSASQLDIVVEAVGRVNYSEAIIDRKGITQNVILTTSDKFEELKNWSVYSIPVDYDFQQKVKYKRMIGNGPAWYKAIFTLSETGNTYLDMTRWGKGLVWVNGHNLGRFWKIGPTQTLYLPGCWLTKGQNEIIVFDVDQPNEPTIYGLDHPILDKNMQDECQLH